MEEEDLLKFLNNEEQLHRFFANHKAEMQELMDKWIDYKNQPNLPAMQKLGDPASEANFDAEKAANEALMFRLKSKQIVLPNGKVNQPYRVTVNLDDLLTEMSEICFEGLEPVGLSFDSQTNRIEGTPVRAGDHKIVLKCKRKDWEEGKPVFEREVALIINPDPRSLWNSIPTPEDIEYYKPDSDKGFVRVEAKKTSLLGKKKRRKDMVAASQRGRSHAHEGKPRDDDFALSFIEPSEWYVMAVADGAGSARYSRKGSQIACTTVIEVCRAKLEEKGETFEKRIQEFKKDASADNRKKVGDVLYEIIASAVFLSYKNIEKEAQEKGAPVKDYATTLILSICKKFPFGWFVGSFWVGDGGIGIYRKEPPFLKIMGEADGGEFAGQTRFLTMAEIIQPTEMYRRLRFEIVEEFTALVLMTDGVTDPKFDTDANLGRIEKWNGLMDDLGSEVNFADDDEETAGKLLGWLDFWSQGNHDDRTIAILY